MADLNEILKRIEEAEARLKQWEAVEIPPTLKQAAKDKWNANWEGVAGKIAYPEAARKLDRQRAIRLSEAIEILRFLEEEMIDAEVSGVLVVIADALTSTYQLAFTVVGAIPAIVRAFTMDAATAWQLVLNIVMNFLAAASLAELGKKAKSIAAMRGRYVASARALALPQRVGPRKWRVKRSREH